VSPELRNPDEDMLVLIKAMLQHATFSPHAVEVSLEFPFGPMTAYPITEAVCEVLGLPGAYGMTDPVWIDYAERLLAELPRFIKERMILASESTQAHAQRKRAR